MRFAAQDRHRRGAAATPTTTVKTASAATHKPPRDAAQRLGDIRHHRADATGCAGGRSCFRAGERFQGLTLEMNMLIQRNASSSPDFPLPRTMAPWAATSAPAVLNLAQLSVTRCAPRSSAPFAQSRNVSPR